MSTPPKQATTATDAALHATLRARFGFDTFRAGQLDIIRQLLAGNSALAIFPTGSGKSLCYQLSALLLDGLTIVVSPLIALMKDQIDFLVSHGIAAARLDSSLPPDEIRANDDALRAGRLKLLYVAPERFSNERFLNKLKRLPIALMVIDEAHCISEWGHNFRPDYMKLARIAASLRVPRVLALTATATPAVADDICREFHIRPEARVHTGFYRPNLHLHATACPGKNLKAENLKAEDKPAGVQITNPPSSPQALQAFRTPGFQNFPPRLALLLERLRARPRGSTIVYVTLQRTSEEIAAALETAGLPARAYHAGLESETRAAVQDWFMASPDAIVVATIAFGMGIDKAGIRYVYHYNLPKSLENYSQEIGRAGRDDAPATCEILADATDITVLENFTYGDTPDPEAIDALVDALLLAPAAAAAPQRAERALDNAGTQDSGLRTPTAGRWTQDTAANAAASNAPDAAPDASNAPAAAARPAGALFDISTYDLSGAHDIRPLVVNTLLTYLELDDIIESTAPFYTEYQFQPLRSSQEILARFDSERAAYLRGIFKTATKGISWFTINIEDATRRLATPRERLTSALAYLEERGDLKLKVAGLRHGYRVLKTTTPADRATLKQTLHARFAQRERNDIQRTRQVVALLSGEGCLTRRLLAHFGEDLGRDCGHCGPCQGEPPVRLADLALKGVASSAPAPADAAAAGAAAPHFPERHLLALLRSENPKALETPRQRARFLCGLTSPRLTRAKLPRHPLFGSHAATPFAQVLSMVA